MHGVKRGVKFPFQISSPLQLGAPSNSGLQRPPCHPLNIIVCRWFEPSQPSLNNPLPAIIAIPPF